MKYLACFLITVFPLSVSAQKPTQSKEASFLGWIGYYASVPKVPFGLVLGMAKKEHIGFYFAAKLNFKTHGWLDPYFYPNISEHKARDIYGHTKSREETGFIIGEVGITNRIARYLYMYGGLGLVSQTQYRKYYDPYEILGYRGFYWIETGQQTTINLNGGFLYFVPNGPCFQFGFDTSPGSVNLGIGIAAAK